MWKKVRIYLFLSVKRVLDAKKTFLENYPKSEWLYQPLLGNKNPPPPPPEVRKNRINPNQTDVGEACQDRGVSCQDTI